MLLSTTAFWLALASGSLVSQVQPLPSPTPYPLPAAAAPATNVVLNNGPCLDSLVSVPHTLNGDSMGAQVVTIDEVVSTATLIAGQVIGYVYTREDGTTWLGQRHERYMSAADSSAINAVLASTHLPGEHVNAFPPVRKFGVKTNYAEFFQVRIPTGALAPLRITVNPCVAWPAGQPLPQPIP